MRGGRAVRPAALYLTLGVLLPLEAQCFTPAARCLDAFEQAILPRASPLAATSSLRSLGRPALARGPRPARRDACVRMRVGFPGDDGGAPESGGGRQSKREWFRAAAPVVLGKPLGLIARVIRAVEKIKRSRRERAMANTNVRYGRGMKTLDRVGGNSTLRADNMFGGPIPLNTTKLYRNSVYRFTDDGRRLSSISRYRDDYWTTNLVTMWRSRVFKRILPHLKFNMIVCVVATVIHWHYPPAAPYLDANVHVITGSFLGLLIAFRTNTGYERFWEARRVWEAVQNKCRNIARMVASSLIGDEELVETVLGMLCAYPFLLKQHLRGQRNLGEIAKFLNENDLEVCSRASNMPVTLCVQMSIALRPLLISNISSTGAKGSIEEQILWEQVNNKIRDLIDSVGAAERIATTPVPLSYSRHTSRFLSMWTLTLPFFMVSYFNPMTCILGYFFICWALLGTEEVGHIIEEPFGTPVSSLRNEDKVTTSENLPLLRYCEAIEDDMEQVKRQYYSLSTTRNPTIDAFAGEIPYHDWDDGTGQDAFDDSMEEDSLDRDALAEYTTGAPQIKRRQHFLGT